MTFLVEYVRKIAKLISIEILLKCRYRERKNMFSLFRKKKYKMYLFLVLKFKLHFNSLFFSPNLKVSTKEIYRWKDSIYHDGFPLMQIVFIHMKKNVIHFLGFSQFLCILSLRVLYLNNFFLISIEYLFIKLI